MDRVNVAVVGLGMGRHHLYCYKNCPQANVVAICDVDEARLQAVGDEYGIKARFTQYEELFALPICTPRRRCRTSCTRRSPSPR